MPEQSTRDEQMLIEFLHDHEDKCPVCDYNLKMLTRAECPECGRGLTLSVGTTEPYLKPWIMLMVAAAGSGGLGVFLCIALSLGNVPSGYGLLPVFYHIAMIPATIFLIIRRRSFIKLNVKQQLLFSWLGVILNSIAFILLILLAVG